MLGTLLILDDFYTCLYKACVSLYDHYQLIIGMRN